MHIIRIDFWSSLIIFTDETSWGKIVFVVKALNDDDLKTTVFAEAKMFTICNKIKQPIITRVIF